ncbi:VIT1/CCC1 transporter family protein [Candidatus Bathyarchaeota archaeon]|nr:VIT1/CCC1 transporter family protein [Candidatus Bathyarchaeota archaeon]MBS7627492.1 VIT1/CCC1 transporter family protein [Candidatus Bathyarchaeota archaeon]
MKMSKDEVRDEGEKEGSSEKGYGLEGAAFGLADGIICFLGIIIGVAEATQDVRFVVISGIIGGIADALGNSIGFFISQSTERGVQIHETVEHGKKVRIHSRKEVWMSGFLSLGATFLALLLLMMPFAFLPLFSAIAFTFLIGNVTLFLLGRYVGHLSGESSIKTGLKFAALGTIGAIVSYGVGDALRHLSGVPDQVPLSLFQK